MECHIKKCRVRCAEKRGSIYRLLNVPPLLFIVFSSFFHAFHQPPATATAGAPNEHGFPAGLIPAGQHSPCIHRFELGQRHGFPTIRALVSSAGWQGRILPPEVVNGYINGSCICECWWMLVVSCCICYTWFLMRSTYSCNIEYILKDQGLALDRFMNGSEKMDKHSGILWGLSPYI